MIHTPVHIRSRTIWGRGRELLTKSRVQGIEKNGFHGERPFRVAVELPATLGVPDVDPMGRAIAGAGKTAGIGEGFQEHRPEMVADFPVADHLFDA